MAKCLVIVMVQAVIATAAMATASSLKAEDAGPRDAEAEVRLAELLRYAQRHFGFSGTVLAARDGKVIASVSVGESRGDDPFPIDANSVFEIGSTTKAVTAIAVFQLRDAGRLKLDDPIKKHLPNVPDDCGGITVRHLLQHTSGIPATNVAGSGTDFDAVLPVFLKGGPQHPPGTRGEYWNQGYSILSEIIARKSGKSYVDYCRDHIFKPAGMTASCFNGDPVPKDHRAVTGDSSRGVPRTGLEHPYVEYGYQYRGMGGMVSTVRDLWRLDRALAEEKLLSAESVAEMTTKPIDGHSPGWQIETAIDGTTIHHHSGSVRGFMADFRRYPHIDGCVAVTWNSDTHRARSVFHGFVTMCEQLLLQPSKAPILPTQHATAVRQTPPAPRSLKKPPVPEFSAEDRSRFSGRYRDQTGRVLIIVPVQNSARTVIIWDPERITPGHLAKDADGTYSFQHSLGEALRITSVEETGGKVRQLTVGTMQFKREDQ